MPEKICEVPCPIIDTKLEKVWAGIRGKVHLTIFIPTVMLIIGLGWYMAKEINSINVSIGKIETQLQLMNGKGERR
ncbi:hypothetical protein LCGC14_2920910 [marine sediment metagenome]|uniref:Uncharacterized protein n=1 Tax=marine sediment metagenome TaxID=412755 RepID=A0A0F8XP25_9ZZZZ